MPPQSAARGRVTVQSGRERSRGGASGGDASLTGMRASQDADRRLVRRPALRLPFIAKGNPQAPDAKRAAGPIEFVGWVEQRETHRWIYPMHDGFRCRSTHPTLPRARQPAS